MAGAPPDPSIHEHFAYTPIPGAKNEIAECIRCHKYRKAKNTSRQKQHLMDHCPEYKDWLTANGRVSGIRMPGPRGRPSGAQKRSRVEAPVVQDDGLGSGSGSGAGLEDFSLQTNFTSAQKRRIDEKLALALYATGQPFSIFEDPLWMDLFKELGYVPPPRQTLVEICLMRVRNAARGGAPVRPFQGANSSAIAGSNGNQPGGVGHMLNTPIISAAAPAQLPGSAQSTPVPASREPAQTPLNEYGVGDY